MNQIDKDFVNFLVSLNIHNEIFLGLLKEEIIESIENEEIINIEFIKEYNKLITIK